MQAEPDFGQDNSSDTTSADPLELLVLLDSNGEEWAVAHARTTENRDGCRRLMPPGTEVLQRTVKQEVIAQEEIWAGHWNRALPAIRIVLGKLTDAGTAKRHARCGTTCASSRHADWPNRPATPHSPPPRTPTTSEPGPPPVGPSGPPPWPSRPHRASSPRLDPLDALAMTTLLAQHDFATPGLFESAVTTARQGLTTTSPSKAARHTADRPAMSPAG